MERREVRVSPSRREELLQSIAQEEGRLARIETEQADSRRRLSALQAELASLDAEPEIRVRLPIAVEAPVPETSTGKVELFRSLFRGREDVFPTRFVSKKTRKPGYAPRARTNGNPGSAPSRPEASAATARTRPSSRSTTPRLSGI